MPEREAGGGWVGPFRSLNHVRRGVDLRPELPRTGIENWRWASSRLETLHIPGMRTQKRGELKLMFIPREVRIEQTHGRDGAEGGAQMPELSSLGLSENSIYGSTFWFKLWCS